MPWWVLTSAELDEAESGGRTWRCWADAPRREGESCETKDRPSVRCLSGGNERVLEVEGVARFACSRVESCPSNLVVRSERCGRRDRVNHDGRVDASPFPCRLRRRARLPLNFLPSLELR